MTQAQLGKVWLAVSAFLLFYALNSWIVAQGGQEIFGAKLVVSKKVPAAMVAIPITSVLLLLTSLVGRLFAARGGPTWQQRIPVVGFDSIDPYSREGTIYQGFMLAIFSSLPVGSLIYFWWTFLTAKVVLNDGSNKLVGLWNWAPTLKSLNDPARICTDFHPELPNPCVGNATLLPGLEPSILALLTLIALVAVVMHWCRVKA